ncbi:MAG: hypothetical protein EBT52_03415 [Flavobacteriia bacterium]|nr:hypothetical protein [Flavobacteriia bacterium]
MVSTFGSKMHKLYLFFMLLPAFSCIDEKQFSNVPFLRFEESEWIQVQVQGVGTVDRLRVRLYFTDGDGDVGLEDEQTDPPFDADSPFHYNLWVRYLEQSGDTLLELPDTEFSIRVPDLTPKGQNKTLEAEIEYDIDLSQAASDSVEFRFILVDRSLQLSNEVSSGLIPSDP